ncbi:glycosyltransferase family protein [Streptomyces spinosisporus]|uniref:Glycosyltransferase n=1 Tax=Streptomyces spinosisporus TaxID=2927582 RepID=A0ABS9XDX6_9ACTN|nr:glycosyltransferase [Streptomyces spinosisporus]MCI3240287.1 glycosyltransferase [Streptomyces spinosisporus]
MRVVVLGAPRPLHLNRWKDCLTEGGTELGWDMLHLPARDIPAEEVVAACRGADLLIWARTHGHNPTGDIPRMLCAIEDNGTATVGLHLDLYWGIRGREPQIGMDPWWSCQWVFTADGGHQAEFLARGVNHRWLPPPLGRRWLGRSKPDRRRFPGRAVFVGSYVPGIHGQHRADLLTWAQRQYSYRFQQYGRSRPVWGADLGTLYASAEVVLGDSAPAARYWSDRMVCTLGRGGLLAHPRTEGMTELGLTDDVMLTYERGDFRGLGERIDALTAARRRELTDAAITLVEERHLWEHRLRDIQREVFGCG